MSEQSERREREPWECPIDISPDDRSICSAGSCYWCLHDRLQAARLSESGAVPENQPWCEHSNCPPSECDICAAAIAAPAPQADEVAEWMIQHSYATGHGDTVADMLSELETQAKERALSQSPTAPGIVAAAEWHKARYAEVMKLDPLTDHYFGYANCHKNSAEFFRSLSASDRREEGK